MEYIFNEAHWHTKQLHCKVREFMCNVSLSVKAEAEDATGYWSGESQQPVVSFCLTIGEEVPIEGNWWLVQISYEKIKTARLCLHVTSLHRIASCCDGQVGPMCLVVSHPIDYANCTVMLRQISLDNESHACLNSCRNSEKYNNSRDLWINDFRFLG